MTTHVLSDSILFKEAKRWAEEHNYQIKEVHKLHKHIDVLLNPDFKIPEQYNVIYTRETENYVKRYMEVRIEGMFDSDASFSLFFQNKHFGRVIWDETLKTSNNILARKLDLLKLCTLFLWSNYDLSDKQDNSLVLAKRRPVVSSLKTEDDEIEEKELSDDEGEIDINKSYIEDRIEFLQVFKDYIWLPDELGNFEIEEDKMALVIDPNSPGHIMVRKGNNESKSLRIDASTMITEVKVLVKDKLHRHRDAKLDLGSRLQGNCTFCSSLTNINKGTKINKMLFCKKTCYNLYNAVDDGQ